MKKLLSLILILILLLPLIPFKTYARGLEAPEEPAASGEPSDSEEPAGPGEPSDPEGPTNPGEFLDGLFSDVDQNHWFFNNVKAVYELGLMQGRGDGEFAPLDGINLAEAVTVAARLRSAYLGDGRDFSGGTPWYAPAVDYAIAQGIIQEGDFTSYTAGATRAQVAYILSRALPSGALEEVNTVEDNSLPDVKIGDRYAAGIYFLYRAGILSGTDKLGTFSPSEALTRAEAAAIASRIAAPSLRVTCEFYAPPAEPEPTYPNLRLKAWADDSFFADTAILGNSLIVGLSGYSNLQTPDYYCAVSLSVDNAGAYVDTMAQKQYRKVYIELGINEIGYPPDYFISLYRAMLDKIRATQPNADIYIMAVTPTSRAMTGSWFSRERVIMYNEALYRLAAQWGCWYLDVFTPLADSEGYLPGADTWDGIHFYAAKYPVWENIIRTYYA